MGSRDGHSRFSRKRFVVGSLQLSNFTLAHIACDSRSLSLHVRPRIRSGNSEIVVFTPCGTAVKVGWSPENCSFKFRILEEKCSQKETLYVVPIPRLIPYIEVCVC